MSIFSENVIPGNHGKVFTTNATKEADLERIKNRILSIAGIKDVIIADTYPIDIVVHTTSLVKVDDIENEVKKTGFHVIPKKLFEL